MPKNKITDVRNHLVAAMEELLDEESQISPERMERLKLTNEFGRTIVESAKAEALYLNSMAKLTRANDNAPIKNNEFFQITQGNEPS